MQTLLILKIAKGCGCLALAGGAVNLNSAVLGSKELATGGNG
jgi:hypothetical protein